MEWKNAGRDAETEIKVRKLPKANPISESNSVSPMSSPESESRVILQELEVCDKEVCQLNWSGRTPEGTPKRK